MGKQSKASLEKLTKGALVDEALNLQDTIENLSSEPLSSAKLVKRKIALVDKGQVTSVTIEKIQADRDVQIAKITKEAELEMTRTLADVIDEHKSIADDINDVDSALKSDIATAEVEASEKIAEYETKTIAAKEAYEATIAAQEADLATREASNTEAVSDLKKTQKRVIDDLDFDHKQALHQKNEKFAETLSKSLGLSLVPTEELKALRSVEAASEKEVQEQIDAAVSAAISRTEAKNGSILNKTKHEAELAQTRLEASVESLNIQLKAANDANASKDAQIAKHPEVVKEALLAAKSAVNVTNEGGKK